MASVILKALSVVWDDVGDVAKVATVMEVLGRVLPRPKKVSPSKRNTKPRSEVHEKRPAHADPPRKKMRKKMVLKSSLQPDEEEEESEPTLVHHKMKLPDQVSPQVGVILFLEFFLHWTWF